MFGVNSDYFTGLIILYLIPWKKILMLCTKMNLFSTGSFCVITNILINFLMIFSKYFLKLKNRNQQ